MSFGRAEQLKDLQEIIQEISKEIMWVNDREEEELMFDWGDKNINQYIPNKQENYSVSLWQPSVGTNTRRLFRSLQVAGQKSSLKVGGFSWNEHFYW